MKRGQQVSQTDLLRSGWHQVDVYGICEIWANDQGRILWNPTTKTIVIVYDAQGMEV